MSLQIHNPVRWNRVSLALGGAAWTIIVLARLSGWIALGDLELILLLALCVITPLALPLVPLPKENRLPAELARWLMFLQPFATLIGGIALLSERGFPATIEALVWLLFTMLIAVLGAMMLLQKSGRQLGTAIFAVVLIYVPIGSA